MDKLGLVRDLNPGPLAPDARIIPLDHQRADTENVYHDKNHNERNYRKKLFLCHMTDYID